MSTKTVKEIELAENQHIPKDRGTTAETEGEIEKVWSRRQAHKQAQTWVEQSQRDDDCVMKR